MAKVTYADAIKTVSGALTKINKKSPHAQDQKMVLATHRVAATTNPNCNRLYISGLQSITRSTPVKTSERASRQRFTAVAAAVAARTMDLSQVTTDQQAFPAQKDNPNGKKTMKAYLWHSNWPLMIHNIKASWEKRCESPSLKDGDFLVMDSPMCPSQRTYQHPTFSMG